MLPACLPVCPEGLNHSSLQAVTNKFGHLPYTPPGIFFSISFPNDFFSLANVLLSLCFYTQDIATLPELAGAIGSAIEESGAVRESASEEVRRARGRVRTIEGRIRGILKVRQDRVRAAYEG